MAGFNFSISKNAPVAHMSKSLKPWGIYDVTFDGFEIREFTSKAGNACKMIDIKFKSEAGDAKISKFWPSDKDGERRAVDAANGGKKYYASNFEETMEALKQLVYALSPKGYEKLSEASVKFKSFDDVAKAINAILSKCNGQQIQIKLGGYINKDGYPTIQIPSLLYVADAEADASTSSIWVGKELSFSDYEASQKAKYDSSKPSNPEKKTKTTESKALPEINDAGPSEDSADDTNWDLDGLADL